MAATSILEIKRAEILLRETRASSIPWVFSPDLDLPRNPSWSRIWESLEKMLICHQKWSGNDFRF
jgi:beta-glucosidase